MGFYLDLEGLDAINKKVAELDTKVKKDVSNEINSSVLAMQSTAKRLAPVNLGQLRNSIIVSPESTGSLTYIVAATASYAPYVEFGTGGKVSIPAGFEEDAAKFKGKSQGTYYDFLMAILEWINKKGIKAGVYNIKTRRRLGNKTQKFDEDVALANRIAYSILRKGIRPQPFLIPAYEQEKPKLIKRLKDLFNA